ncbi:MAG: nuclear transport factor 2 family protein [Chloroflexota bacterium]
MNAHDMFTRLITATNAGDIDALEELFHPEFVGDFPQSGERIHGFAGFRAQLENYPGGIVEVESQLPSAGSMGRKNAGP